MKVILLTMVLPETSEVLQLVHLFGATGWPLIRSVIRATGITLADVTLGAIFGALIWVLVRATDGMMTNLILGVIFGVLGWAIVSTIGGAIANLVSRV